MIFPNLILGGAPKAGTTQLFDLLNRHPDIGGCVPKEPFFLVDPDYPLARRGFNWTESGSERYESIFPTSKSVRMDGTTHLLYQHRLPAELGRRHLTTKVVFLLRDPARRIYSSFNYSKLNLGRVDPEFGFGEYTKALLKGDLDAIRSRVSHSGSAEVLAREFRHSDYVPHLERWLANIDSAQLHIIVFEEYIRDPVAVGNEVLAWAGLPALAGETVDASAANETQRFISGRAHRGVRALARAIPFGQIRSVLKTGYVRVFGRKVERAVDEADAKAIQMLREAFVPAVDRLSNFLGRPFPEWNRS